MGKLIELAERAERATADEQRAILEEAWDLLGPIVKWRADQARRFGMMIDAEAYESAAILLVPTGYGWRLWMPNSTCIALLRVTMWGNGRTYAPTDSEAATPALAICASSLRARDGGEGL